MRHLLLPLVLIAVVLAVPIVPFVLWGGPIERQMEEWLDTRLPPAVVGAVVAGILATDVFLPVPSSVVSTFAGRALGFAPSVVVTWLGMTVGVTVGFGLARWLGRPLALRFSRAEDLARIDAMSQRFGPLVLVLARPVPVLAEATVLFFGATRLPWGRFLAPVMLSNLGIAAAYAALGEWVQLPIALAASVLLPLAAAAVARKLWPAAEAE